MLHDSAARDSSPPDPAAAEALPHRSVVLHRPLRATRRPRDARHGRAAAPPHGIADGQRAVQPQRAVDESLRVEGWHWYDNRWVYQGHSVEWRRTEGCPARPGHAVGGMRRRFTSPWPGQPGPRPSKLKTPHETPSTTFRRDAQTIPTGLSPARARCRAGRGRRPSRPRCRGVCCGGR